MRTVNHLIYEALRDEELLEKHIFNGDLEGTEIESIRYFYDENGFSTEAKKDLHILLSLFDTVYLNEDMNIQDIKNEICSSIETLTNCIEIYPFNFTDEYNKSVDLVNKLKDFNKEFKVLPISDMPDIGTLFKSKKRGHVNIVACTIRYIAFCLLDVSKRYPEIDIKKGSIHKYIQSASFYILLHSHLCRTVFYRDSHNKILETELTPAMVSQHLKDLRDENKSYEFFR